MSESKINPSVDLKILFEEINMRHFAGVLDPPLLRWNARLRSSAGRFISKSRRFFLQEIPVIEIALYLLEEERKMELIRDTLAHEMIHYWLWVRRRPHGHTPEFMGKLKEIGASRYNSVPRKRPLRYVYRCEGCGKEFFARKKLRNLACAQCCKEHAGGRFDPRFRLCFDRHL